MKASQEDDFDEDVQKNTLHFFGELTISCLEVFSSLDPRILLNFSKGIKNGSEPIMPNYKIDG